MHVRPAELPRRDWSKAPRKEHVLYDVIGLPFFILLPTSGWNPMRQLFASEQRPSTGSGQKQGGEGWADRCKNNAPKKKNPTGQRIHTQAAASLSAGIREEKLSTSSSRVGEKWRTRRDKMADVQSLFPPSPH